MASILWWERLIEIAYQMAHETDQTNAFFDMVEGLRRAAMLPRQHSDTAMDTLLGKEWSAHRYRQKRRDLIPNQAKFDVADDAQEYNNGDKDHHMVISDSQTGNLIVLNSLESGGSVRSASPARFDSVKENSGRVADQCPPSKSLSSASTNNAGETQSPVFQATKSSPYDREVIVKESISPTRISPINTNIRSPSKSKGTSIESVLADTSSSVERASKLALLDNGNSLEEYSESSSSPAKNVEQQNAAISSGVAESETMKSGEPSPSPLLPSSAEDAVDSTRVVDVPEQILSSPDMSSHRDSGNRKRSSGVAGTIKIKGKSSESKPRRSLPKAKKKRVPKPSTSKAWIVKSLRDVKMSNGELVYKIEWKGPWDDTWEPYVFVAHLEDDILSVYKTADPEIKAAMIAAGHVPSEQQ
uniref:Chromo domain-containing protein n=1 Tax=Spongospora subterranea TaxID=70186 RepID=A0A0H5R5L2_9EUKA|eukprot:CRZ09067.1 hypothetical protein [Spongospora subterranea]